jgi:hypothetical protein
MEEDDLDFLLQQTDKTECQTILDGWKTFVSSRNFVIGDVVDRYVNGLERLHGYEIQDFVENYSNPEREKRIVMRLIINENPTEEKTEESPCCKESVSIIESLDIDGRSMHMELTGIQMPDQYQQWTDSGHTHGHVKLDFNDKEGIDKTVSKFSKVCRELLGKLDREKSILRKILSKVHDTTLFLQLLMLLTVCGTGLALRTSVSFDDIYGAGDDQIKRYLYSFATRPVMCKCCFSERLTMNKDRGTFNLRTFIRACISHEQLEIYRLTYALANSPTEVTNAIPEKDNVILDEPEFGFFAQKPALQSNKYKHYKSILRIYVVQAREILKSKGLLVPSKYQDSSSSSSSSSPLPGSNSGRLIPTKRLHRETVIIS